MKTKTKPKRAPVKTPEHAYVEEKKPSTVVARICLDRRCKFHGAPQQQGVCYSSSSEILDWQKMEARERELVTELRQIKKNEGARYPTALEAYYVTAMLNWTIALDEVVQLRRENALLKLERPPGGLRAGTTRRAALRRGRGTR